MNQLSKIFLILTFLVSTAYAQRNYDYYTLLVERDYFRKEGWMALSIGGLSHGGGIICLQYGPLTNPNVRAGFMIFNGVGLALDFRAYLMFKEARKRTKLMHSTPCFP